MVKNVSCRLLIFVAQIIIYLADQKYPLLRSPFDKWTKDLFLGPPLHMRGSIAYL